VLIRAGHRGGRQFRLGFSDGNVFPPGGVGGEVTVLRGLAGGDPALGVIGCEEYDSVCPAFRYRFLDRYFGWSRRGGGGGYSPPLPFSVASGADQCAMSHS
jgi:hypothetical protein